MYCEPILSEEIDFQEMVDMAIEHGRNARWKSVEFRHGSRFPENLTPSATFSRHTIDLSRSEKAMIAGFRRDTRARIRRARNKGVSITVSTSSDSMGEFYRLYCDTRKRLGVPPQPLYFFKKLHKLVVRSGMGAVARASVRGQVIAATVFLSFGRNVICKYSASTSDPELRRIGATHLMLSEMIRVYAERGYAQMCLGRTDSSNHGLREFKKGWRGKEEVLRYHTYNLGAGRYHQAESTQTNRVRRAIFSRLPIGLSRIASAVASRHFG